MTGRFPEIRVTLVTSSWAAYGWRSLAVDMSFLAVLVVVAFFLYPFVSDLVDHLASRDGDR